MRAAAHCLSYFIAGDPGTADPTYREEVAQALLEEFRPGGNLESRHLLDAATAYADLVDAHWPDAQVTRQLALRGQLANRAYLGRIDWLGELPDGSLILIVDVCLSPKQYLKVAAGKLAEVRLQAELLSQQLGKPVHTALLHLPAAGTLTRGRAVNILLLAATPPEIVPTVTWLRAHAAEQRRNTLVFPRCSVTVLFSGLGTMSTAYLLGSHFALPTQPALAIQGGSQVRWIGP